MIVWNMDPASTVILEYGKYISIKFLFKHALGVDLLFTHPLPVL
jgi:hypothetical protein